MVIENEEVQKRVKTLEELVSISERLKSEGKKIVHCHGVFDGLHIGHFQYFSSAKKEGDILIVTVTADEFVNRGPGRPLLKEEERADGIASVRFVDYVAINYATTAVEAIKRLKPDVYAKGEEFADLKDDKISHEKEAIESVGGRLYFTKGITSSSSRIINNYFDIYPKEAREFLQDFKKRYKSEEINEKLKELRPLNVLILGESIIDEYHYCEPMGKSAKENIIALKYISEERFAGGALATANNTAGFCENVHLLTLLGKEPTDADFIYSRLKRGITPAFFYDSRPTIKKRRIIEQAFMQKLSEICVFDDSPISSKLEEAIVEHLKSKIKKYDLVIVSDYGHGLITPKIVGLLCEQSRFLAVNAQANSANMGFNLITKYPRADYICIDSKEARLAVQDKWSSLCEIYKKIRTEGDYNIVIITAGHKGSYIYSKKEDFEIPALSSKVIDRMGAGDAYFSITAPCVFREYPLQMIGFVGNVAGAMASNIVGHRDNIDPDTLYKFVTTLLK